MREKLARTVLSLLAVLAAVFAFRWTVRTALTRAYRAESTVRPLEVAVEPADKVHDLAALVPKELEVNIAGLSVNHKVRDMIRFILLFIYQQNPVSLKVFDGVLRQRLPERTAENQQQIRAFHLVGGRCDPAVGNHLAVQHDLRTHQTAAVRAVRQRKGVPDEFHRKLGAAVGAPVLKDRPVHFHEAADPRPSRKAVDRARDDRIDPSVVFHPFQSGKGRSRRAQLHENLRPVVIEENPRSGVEHRSRKDLLGRVTVPCLHRIGVVAVPVVKASAVRGDLHSKQTDDMVASFDGFRHSFKLHRRPPLSSGYSVTPWSAR